MKKILLIFLICFQAGLSFGENDSIPEKKGLKIIRPALIGSGILATCALTYQFADAPVQRFSQANQSAIPGFMAEISEPFGTAEVLIPLQVGFYLTGAITQNKKLAKAGAAGLTALLMNDIINTRLKYTFERHRPNSGSPYNTFDGPDGGNLHRSLPSGHTSSAFASAIAIATVYKDVKWVPPVAYGIATLVGLSRIYTNHHWASDVLAGAAVGFVCGKLSAAGWNWLERKNIAIIPSFGKNRNSLSLIHRF